MFFNARLLKLIQLHAAKSQPKEASQAILAELGVTDVSVEGELPAEGPLLLVSNHPGDSIDLLALLSCTQRTDFHFIALSTYSILGKAIREKLLPMYRKPGVIEGIFELLLYMQVLGKIPEKILVEEMQQKNRSTLAKAADIVNQGNAVLLFPTGGIGRVVPGSAWKPGLGFLLQQLATPKTNIVFAHITGTTKSDPFLYLHPILRSLGFSPQPITVTFSKAMKIREVMGDTNVSLLSEADKKTQAKEITRQLEKRYGEVFG